MSRHKTVLVTGGAGFIGSEFVKLLVSRGYRPVVVDKLTYAGDLRRLAAVKGRYVFCKADICGKKNMVDIFRRKKGNIYYTSTEQGLPSCRVAKGELIIKDTLA